MIDTQTVNQADIYYKLMLLMVSSKRHMFEAISRYDLTPVQGTLLIVLEPGESRSMHKLSYVMGCDASNITGLVDRLETQGLIERTSDPQDRRVKRIQLSVKGVGCRNEILSSLQKAEAINLTKLTAEEQMTLTNIIDKLTTGIQ